MNRNEAIASNPGGGRRLSIALTADPELPVPPNLYGGIERIVDLLARGLEVRGHNVTLFAHPDSRSGGHLIPWPGRASQSRLDTLRNSWTLARHVLNAEFDILHSFSRLAYLAPILPSSLPKVMTYQREISPRTTQLAYRLSRGSLGFTAISRWMIDPVAHIGRWRMIPNGVSIGTYKCNRHVSDDAPLVFLGRIEEIKGPHLAIEVSKRTGRRLVIAGNIPSEKARWVEQNVLAFVDGEQISYIGPVDDAQKNRLLGEAAALLMPILWEEPFGIVMIEAMACGTPVIGLARGAVPEVVIDGVTGFVCRVTDEMATAVGRLGAIDRLACRRHVEENYSQDAVVEAYLSLYNDCIAAATAPATSCARS